MTYIILGVTFFVVIASFLLIFSAKSDYNDKFEDDINTLRKQIEQDLKTILNFDGYGNDSQNMLLVLHRLKHIELIKKNYKFLHYVFSHKDIAITSDPIKVIFKLEDILKDIKTLYNEMVYERRWQALLEVSTTHVDGDTILKELRAVEELEGLEAKVKQLVKLSYKYELLGI